MPTLDRARAKHNERVAQLAKARAAQEKALAALIRKEAKRLECERAVIRSAKGLEKIRAAAVYTGGPTATAVEPLVDAVVTKPTPAAKLNDDVPSLAKAVPLKDLPKTPEGKANAESWNAIPAVKRSRKRRTPDDFKADMTGKKSTTDGVDGR